jgi:hypothetical protein
LHRCRSTRRSRVFRWSVIRRQRRLLSAVRRGSEGQPHVALALEAIRTVAQALPSVEMAGRPAA